MEDLSKDRLMRLQVEQLEKEKKDLNERLRIAAKRIDHVERAYRKEERPLLAQDYADQQAADRVTFEALQKSRIENSLAAHTQALASKKRLGRMQDEYKAHRTRLLAARSEEYERLKASAEKKLEEEKEKRRKAFAAEKEAEIRRLEEEATAERQAEEELLRIETGAYLMSVSICVTLTCNCTTERREKEEAEAERKREEEERLAEQRRERELERAAAAEEARKKAQREEEAEERARLRAQAKTSAPPTAPESGVWRRPSAQTSSAPAPRTQSPAPAPSPLSATGPPKIGAGGWRQRMAEKEKQGAPGTPTSATSSPVTTNAALPEVKKDTDGFETVPAKGVWKPTRLRGKV